MNTETKALDAFARYDQSVFLGWMEAMSDLLMSGGDTAQMAGTTLPNIGGLMFALTEAAQELAQREREEA